LLKQDLKPESRKAFKSSRGISLRMKNLDREEFKNSLKHYEQALNSGFPPLTEHESEFLNVLTQGNPKKLRENITTYSAIDNLRSL